MNRNKPTVEPGGAEHASAEQEPAATRALGLLSAVDIWSTGSKSSASPQPAENNSKQGATGKAAAPPASSRSTSPPQSLPKAVAPQTIPWRWPPQRLSLALQGGGSFAAFAWGVLERLLEEPELAFDAISGASAGAVNAALFACGLVDGGREGARARLRQFWFRTMNNPSFRSLMLVGGFSPAGSSVAFGPALRSGQFDPFDFDPLRQALTQDIDFAALREARCPKLLVAATRVHDGAQKIFRNGDITADALLASICPPQVHCAVEIEGEAYWDGGFAANPPLVHLIRESEAADVLVVQVTPTRDSYIPITMAAIDRRLDQIMANSALNAEVSALEWARQAGAVSPQIHRIAAEDEIEGLAQRSAVDLGANFITLLHRHGRAAADRWLRRSPDPHPAAIAKPQEEPVESLPSRLAPMPTV